MQYFDNDLMIPLKEWEEMCPICEHTWCLMDIEYCGFTTVEEIIKDHKWLKDDIKGREKECDRIVAILNKYDWIDNDLPSPQSLAEDVEQMSQEMMSINM